MLQLQADACRGLGSPLYGDLLTRAADDASAGGPVAEVLGGHEDDPGPSALALRLMGGVHALVLAGEAPRLAAAYPSAGGRYVDADATWRAFLEVVRERADDLRPWLDLPPQTNEVGRAAALAGALVQLVAAAPLPVRLFEIGASAGLNLRADRYRYLTEDGRAWGPVDSPVVLRDAWRGAVPVDTAVHVVERAGCDVAPIDAGSAQGRLRLMAYVWPDQVERFARLRAALEVAAQVPARVVAAPARDFVDALELASGTVTVVWHSVMWQYLSTAERAAVLGRLDELGGDAGADRLLAHIALEPRRVATGEHSFVVSLQRWPDGGEQVLGVAAAHGVPVEWAPDVG